MSLADLIVSRPVLDRGGAIGANRFDYQVDWALNQLIDLVKSGQNFAIVLDLHDDALILDSDVAPSLVKVYQIKSRSQGHWTIPQLTKRSAAKLSGAKPSVVGKLYRHHEVWKPHVALVAFVSNAGLKATDNAGRSTLHMPTVRIGALADSEKKKVVDALRKEIPLDPVDTPELSIMEFQQSSLQCVGHSHQCLGLLAQYLEEDSRTRHIPPAALYRAIKAVLLRATHNENVPSQMTDLILQKAISRADFTQMIAAAASERSELDVGKFIVQRLNAEGAPFRLVSQMRGLLVRASLARADPTDLLLHDDLKTIAECQAASAPCDSLSSGIEAVRSEMLASGSDVERRRGAGMTQALISMVLYEKTELSASTEESAEQET